MALGDPYATLDELKTRLNVTDSGHDDELGDKLAGASREVEDYCSRQFNDAGAASARVYRPNQGCWAEVDDFHTVVDLVVASDDGAGGYTAVWDEADYELHPLNGVADGVPGWPYSELTATGSRTFGHWAARRAPLQVTARWGWAAVPAPVKDAALILAAESFKLREAPFGVAGFGDFGVVRVRDQPMVARKLRRYVRDLVLVG